jgi:hypothetical protein
MTLKFMPAPPPLESGETVTEYGHRLEGLGFDEMLIRKKILQHFSRADLNETLIFNGLSDARIRYVTMIHQLNPKKPYKGLIRKLAASVGVSEDEAEISINRYGETGGLPFVPWSRSQK